MLGTLALGCSSLEPDPPSKGCQADADCTVEGEACFNGQCSAGDTPPRPLLAFEIQERSAGATPLFRAQLRGCDLLVGGVDNEPGVLQVRRSDVVQTFEFQVHTHPDVDPEMLLPDDLLAATLEVTQADRLNRSPNPVRRSVDHAPDLFDPDGNPLEEVATFIPWPRYHPLDLGLPPAHVLWETKPLDQPPVVRMFRPFQFEDESVCTQNSDCCDTPGCNPFPNYCSIGVGATEGRCSLIGNPSFIQTYVYDGQCARGIQGDVVTFDVDSGLPFGPLSGAGVRFRYADAPDAPPLSVFDSNNIPLSERPAMCQTDEECGSSDLACDLATQQCVARLAGRTADGGSTSADDGRFGSQVYTYCEGADPNAVLERAYSVTVSPPGPRPSVTYDLLAEFSPASAQSPPFLIAQSLCVPDWGQDAAIGGPVVLPLRGPARTLVAGGTAAVRCCDIGCLPATSDDFDSTLVGPTGCEGRTSGGVPPTIRMETTFTLDEEARTRWATQCLTPVDGVVGRLSVAVDCSGEGACTLTNLAWGTADAARSYELRVESPVGSVLASRILPIELGPDPDPDDDMPPDIGTIDLGPRVLVRGVVTVDNETCAARDDPTDCTSKGAVVVAERLAMPAVGGRPAETNANVPGPYFHQVSTYFDPVQNRDGAYTLPLDPGGVYILTALPAAGQDGGPAPYRIVDLRNKAEHTEDLVLEDGLLVTLLLDTFDRRSTVVPLDTGSEATLTHPGRFETGEIDPMVDLSRVGECLAPATEPSSACRIRQLTVPGSNLTLSQVGITRFKARAPVRPQDADCGG
jgi:hypothetical protein